MNHKRNIFKAGGQDLEVNYSHMAKRSQCNKKWFIISYLMPNILRICSFPNSIEQLLFPPRSPSRHLPLYLHSSLFLSFIHLFALSALQTRFPIFCSKADVQLSSACLNHDTAPRWEALLAWVVNTKRADISSLFPFICLQSTSSKMCFLPRIQSSVVANPQLRTMKRQGGGGWEVGHYSLQSSAS